MGEDMNKRIVHCAAIAETATPDAIIRHVACGKPRRRHGWWHQNRQVRWWGRWVRPVSVGESVVNEAERFLR